MSAMTTRRARNQTATWALEFASSKQNSPLQLRGRVPCHIAARGQPSLNSVVIVLHPETYQDGE